MMRFQLSSLCIGRDIFLYVRNDGRNQEIELNHTQTLVPHMGGNILRPKTLSIYQTASIPYVSIPL
jgi:hypothetical protein